MFALDRRARRARAVIGAGLALAGVGLVLTGAVSSPVNSVHLLAGTVATALGVLVLGLLRAIGMDRQQVRSMIRWEAAIMAAIGTTVGLGLGAFLGWAISRDLDLPATIPVAQLALFAAAALMVGVLAATLPARRAARVDMLRAIAAE